MTDTVIVDEFSLDYEPSKMSRSLIALDPAVATPKCERLIKELEQQSQHALAANIKGIRNLFGKKRDALRRKYEASLREIDEQEVSAIRSYFCSMFANQSFLQRTGTMLRWMLGRTKGIES